MEDRVSLGDIYKTGDGVPKDSVEAAKWYRMAADQGNKTAIENLRALSERLQGVDAELWQAANAAAQQAAANVDLGSSATVPRRQPPMAIPLAQDRGPRAGSLRGVVELSRCAATLGYKLKKVPHP